MDFLANMKSSVNSYSVIYDEILKSYNKSNKVYAICEGKYDYIYYDHFFYKIKNLELTHSNSKNGVMHLYELLFKNNNNYSKDRIIFFIDKDLSFWENDIVKDDNIYITDYYSIENNLIYDYIFVQLLKCSNITNLTNEQCTDLKIKFNKIICNFREKMKNVMSDFLLSKINSNSNFIFDIFNYVNIDLERLYICVSYNPINSQNLIDEKIMEFNNYPEEYSVRGKWEFDFIYKLYTIIIEDIKNNYEITIKKMNKDTLFKTAVLYSKLPGSLRAFLINRNLNNFLDN